MILWIKSLWWRWRNRCIMVRQSSADIPYGSLAQIYLDHLHCNYIPCKVCGEERCRWAVKREKPLEVPEERKRQIQRLLDWDYRHRR